MDELVNLLIEYGVVGLAVVAFAEAFFFPVPPDALLVPLTLMAPERGFWYALSCTFASTAGALFGHFLGKQAGRPLLMRFAKKRLTRVEDLFRQYGGWAVAFAALTPVPFKIFTIAAGVFLVRRRIVFVSSLLGRGIRFLFEVLVVDFMGSTAVAFLKDYLGPITFGIGVLLIGWAGWCAWRRRRSVG